jgi:hypothetical protein
VEWNGPHDSQWINGVVYSNVGRGVWVRVNGNGLIMCNVHSWGLVQVHAFFLEGLGVGLANCLGEGAGGAGSPAPGAEGAGQVFVGANDCWAMGGSFFAAGGATTGFIIGDGTHTNLSGIKIDTKILNCITAAISLVQDGGGNVFRVNAFQVSGPVTTGTLNANSSLEAIVTGGGTGSTMSMVASTSVAAPAAGGAGALPATPLGYAIVNINGTSRKVPFYANP